MPAVNRAEPAQTTERQHLLGHLIYSQSRAARWLRRIVAMLTVMLGLVALKGAATSLLPNKVGGKDFVQTYTLARAILDRVDPYLPTDVLAKRYLGHVPFAAWPHPTPHPPALGVLLLPIAFLDYATAATVWFVFELICLVVSAHFLVHGFSAQLSRLAVLCVAIALVAWHPVATEMFMGQLQLPMLALLAGAWLALRKGWPGLGGALVGLAILIKPIPVPMLLWFALSRRWRALGGAVCVILTGYAVTGCLVGLETLVTYVTSVVPSITHVYRAALGNHSLWSVGWRLFEGTGCDVFGATVVPPLIRSAAGARFVAMALPILVLLAASLFVRGQRSLGVSFAVMVSVSILISPLSWPHYLVLAAIPGAQVVRWLLCHRLPRRETNRALVVASLLLANWVGLTSLALAISLPDGAVWLAFALAQIPLMTAVSVGALAWLVASLGPAEADMIPTL